MPGYGAASHFHRHDGRGAFQKRKDKNAQHVKVGTFVVDRFRHIRGKWSYQPIAAQNAEEGAYQRGRDFVPNFFRRPTKRAHGNDNPEHGGNDPQAWQGICHGAQSRDGLCRLVVLHFHVKFKQINDSHGHPIGDAVLREVAHRLLESVRNYDYVGRYGGEEFLVVLPECAPSDLIVTAERMRAHVSEKPVETDLGPIPVTISIGVAGQRPLGSELPREEELLRAADTALYCAKANGRNRVEQAPGIHPGDSARAATVQ